MKVHKVKKPGVGWVKSSSDPVLALCDGAAPPPPAFRRLTHVAPGGGGASTVDGASSHASCMVAVESLESSIAELKSLKLEIEAQTWSVVEIQDDSRKNNFRFFLVG
jgi:hypothetical protein